MTKAASKRKGAAKARNWWAYPYEDGYVVTDVPPTPADVKSGWCKPVAVLDLDPESIAAIREQVARELYDQRMEWESAHDPIPDFWLRWDRMDEGAKKYWRAAAKSALASLNLTATPVSPNPENAGHPIKHPSGRFVYVSKEAHDIIEALHAEIRQQNPGNGPGDTEMLDWVLAGNTVVVRVGEYDYHSCLHYPFDRAAIRSAMRAEREGKPV